VLDGTIPVADGRTVEKSAEERKRSSPTTARADDRFVDVHEGNPVARLACIGARFVCIGDAACSLCVLNVAMPSCFCGDDCRVFQKSALAAVGAVGERPTGRNWGDTHGKSSGEMRADAGACAMSAASLAQHDLQSSLSFGELNALRRIANGVAHFLSHEHRKRLSSMGLVELTLRGDVVLTEAGRRCLAAEAVGSLLHEATSQTATAP
jgi:hypothetical protein